MNRPLPLFATQIGYEYLRCTLFFPGDPGNEFRATHSIVLELPDGPEVWDDPVAGILTVPYPRLEQCVANLITVVGALGFRGRIDLCDEDRTTTYVEIDFGPGKPRVRCRAGAIVQCKERPGI